MLLRMYRVTDRAGLVLIKSSAALGDWLLEGTQTTTSTLWGVLRGAFSLIMIGVALLASLVWMLLRGIFRGIRAILGLILGGILLVGGVVSGARGRRQAETSDIPLFEPVAEGLDDAPLGEDGLPLRPAVSRRQRAQNRVRTYETTADKVKEDPLKIQNRRLSMLVVGLGVLVIVAVIWATDPSRSPSNRPINAVSDNAGSSLVINNATLQPTTDSAAGISIPTAIPTATPQPEAFRAGGTLAYTVRESGQSDIWAVGIGSRTPIRILNNVLDERDPAWSADGTKLAYAARQDGNWEIYTYELATQTVTRITYDLSFQANPSWSDDGAWLAYESYQGNNLDVYAVPIDGAEAPIRITDSEAPDFSPAWSPDGRKIAFVSWRDGNQDIYIFDLNTLDVSNVTSTPGRNEDYPAWSSDGNHLAFSAVDAGREKIFVQAMNTPNAQAEAIALGRTPSWSPEGLTLTYIVDADDKSRTYIHAVPFGGDSTITSEVIAVPYGAAAPVWSEQIIPPQLANSGGLPLSVTDALFVEQFQTNETEAPYRLSSLLDVQAPRSFLSDRVNDSFNALRTRVRTAVGLDYLSTLDDAWWDLERRPEAGEERRNWHMTGRAFAITRAGILGFPAPIEIVREDTDTATYWRIYLRVDEGLQNGQLGEPLRRMPWDFLSRSQGDVEAYNQGGRLRGQVPSGYYVDLTQLAADYGWEWRAAGNDWRANSNSINYWLFWKPEGLDWYTAMREIHNAGELVNFAPTPTPGQ
jgi:TolB protein